MENQQQENQLPEGEQDQNKDIHPDAVVHEPYRPPVRPAEPGFWEKNKLLIKGFLTGFLILVMLIPLAMLHDLVREREMRQEQVIEEISSKWASSQTVFGPVVAVPYLAKVANGKDENGPVYTTSRLHFYMLPDQLSINGKLLPEVRHRSLYDVTLYRSELSLTGTFDPTYAEKLGIPAENILWNEAHLMLGLDDARGLEENVQLRWNNTSSVLEAGLPENTVIKTGLAAKVQIDSSKPIPFHISVHLKGSSHLYFTPVGKTTEVSLSSPWRSPAFDGQYLPATPAVINEKGFSAKWKVLQVSRSYPQVWKDGAQYNIPESAFGVKLLQPADSYAKTERSVKYGLLVIALTFTVFFFIEILQKRQVHPLQYILVGIALCVFYSLLLSVSEYLGFNIAYMIATIATVTLICLYVLGIFKKAAIAGGFGLALGGLYTYLFILIQLEDYALLFGSIGLFVILAIIMYFSRKIDWYGTAKA